MLKGVNSSMNNISQTVTDSNEQVSNTMNNISQTVTQSNQQVSERVHNISQTVTDSNQQVSDAVQSCTQNIGKQVTTQVQKVILGEETVDDKSENPQVPNLKAIMIEQKEEQAKEIAQMKDEIVKHNEKNKEAIVHHTNEKSRESSEKEER